MVKCGGRARDVRSMWVFGLQGEELKAATECRRPAGHRGDCLHNPRDPEPPLKPLKHSALDSILNG